MSTKLLDISTAIADIAKQVGELDVLAQHQAAATEEITASMTELGCSHRRFEELHLKYSSNLQRLTYIVTYLFHRKELIKC